MRRSCRAYGEHCLRGAVIEGSALKVIKRARHWATRAAP